MTAIKRFVKYGVAGQSYYPAIFENLDKLEIEICAEFDEWKNGKTIISAIPTRYPNAVPSPIAELTVLYEINSGMGR